MSYDTEQLTTGYKGRFVIQDHYATNRHWDLRLEFPVDSLSASLGSYSGKRTKESPEPQAKYPDRPGSVLRSWAIPKHTTPTSKPLLAQETEDHDISYRKFRGTIPEGQYGAGKVKIYDSGTFEIVEMDYDKKYVVKFSGKKLKGYYVLIKTGPKKFLWIKVKDTAKYKKQAQRGEPDLSDPRKYTDEFIRVHKCLRRGRDYGEYCSDFVEQNALELYKKFKSRGWPFPERLANSIMERNPKILKFASKQKPKDSYDSEKIVDDIVQSEITKRVVMPLMVRRDYGQDGHDQLEQDALELKEDGKLPKKLEKDLEKRLEPFPAKKASIIDYPKQNLTPWLWDLSVWPPKLKPEVRQNILGMLFNTLDMKVVDPYDWITEITLTGSITTNQYDADTDVDVNVSVDYDQFKKDNPGLHFANDHDVRTFLREIVYTHNGTKIAGNHPLKYFVIGKGHRLESDFVYDIWYDQWMDEPKLVSLNFDPDDTFNTQHAKALAICNDVTGLLVGIRSLVSDLKRRRDAVKRNQKKEAAVEAEIAKSIGILVDAYDQIKTLRKIRFKEKNPVLLGYKFSNNWEENNILFKYIERMGFKKPIKLLPYVLTSKEIDIIEEIVPGTKKKM